LHLELGKKQEARYRNRKGQWVRWAFVQVENVKHLGRIIAKIDYHAVLQADLSPELKAGSRVDCAAFLSVSFQARRSFA
jgi:hypothetical protein